MSTIKFVYRSQNIPDTVPTEGSEKTITSGAVYTAINNIQMDTLFKSGYLPEGVANAEAQHILSYEDNNLTLEAGSTLFVPCGIVDGLFEFNVITTTEDISNSATYSSDMDAYVFCDTTENKLVARTKRSNTRSAATGEPQDSALQQVWAQLTEPVVSASSTSNGVIWWDLTENLIKVYNSSSDTWDVTEYSIPLCVVSSDNGKISGIIQDFSSSGALGNITWINPGVSFVIPTGRDTKTGTYTNEIIETTEVICKIILTDTNDEFEDYALYINLDGDIEGPVEEYTFDNTLGLFIDVDGESHKSCRYATLSAAHLTTSSSDPLTITDYTPRQPFTLASSDDVEYLVKLIGSSMGVTIDDLQAEIDDTLTTIADVRQEILDAIEVAKEDVAADMHHVMVHRQLPDGFTESVLYPDIKLDETIYGVKTFVEEIKGNVSGSSQQVHISKTADEIVPVGLTSFEDNGAYSLQLLDTDVRIGIDYVTATTFKGVATSTDWADLAEIYETDNNYEIGTLLKWGGESELTIADSGVCNAVVSDRPGLLMNSESKGQPIALAGRVKVRVLGEVKKHDPITLSEVPGVGKVQENESKPVIARALESNESVKEKLVLCVVKFTL